MSILDSRVYRWSEVAADFFLLNLMWLLACLPVVTAPPATAAMFAVVRLAFDQTVENTTGVGAPPASWPRGELAVDLLHKAVYAVATSVAADAVIQPSLESRRGPRSH